MSLDAATVSTTIEASIDEAFGQIVPIDLTSIFTGYGPLPAVMQTRDQSGAWDAAGRTRNVAFSDGSTARESLPEYEYPHRFAYTIDHFTGVLRLLASEARGEWWFEQVPGRKATAIRWRYQFVSRSKFLEPLVGLFTRLLWRGYMLKALSLSKAKVEAKPPNAA
jgi:hypothetical protein